MATQSLTQTLANIGDSTRTAAALPSMAWEVSWQAWCEVWDPGEQSSRYSLSNVADCSSSFATSGHRPLDDLPHYYAHAPLPPRPRWYTASPPSWAAALPLINLAKPVHTSIDVAACSARLKGGGAPWRLLLLPPLVGLTTGLGQVGSANTAPTRRNRTLNGFNRTRLL
jgi:hypothetical protein